MTKRIDVQLQLEVGGATFEPRSARVVEGLSELGGAWVEVALVSDHDFESALDGDAVLTVTVAGQPARRFTYRLARCSFAGLKEGSLRFELELRPAFWFLRFGKNVRKFRDETADAIVRTILSENGVRPAFRLTRPPASRPYCVQYRETHLDFVQRLLEFEGIFYAFDEDGTMVLGDRSPACPPVEGDSSFELVDPTGALEVGRLGVFAFGTGARVTSGRATVNDHNWKTPKTSLLVTAPSGQDDDLEIYDYPVGYRDAGVGRTLAQLRTEALVATRRFAEGVSNVPAFAAGRTFDFTHDDPTTGSWLLTSVEHVFETHVEGRPARYENRFKCIPLAVPFRPPLLTPVPVVQGNHTAMVRGPAGEEIHTDAFGRAKVQFHWDREAKGTDEDSRWIRMVQETSSSMALARVGWELNVAYVAGDPDRPLGLARLINGQMTPIYAQPASKNVMSIKTETYPGKVGFNEVRMDDSDGAMRIDVQAERDFITIVKNDKTETVGHDETHLVKKGLSMVTEKNQTTAVGTNESQAAGGDMRIVVKLDRTKKVGGSEKVEVKGSTNINIEGNDLETVGGLRFSFVGGIKVQIPDAKELVKELVPGTSDLQAAAGSVAGGGSAAAAAKGLVPSPKAALSKATGGLSDIRKPADLAKLLSGQINRATDKRFTRTVGGAQIQLAGQSISTSVGKLSVEAVGGVRLALVAKESHSQHISGHLVTAVGGMILRKAKGDITYASKTSMVAAGMTASYVSDEKIEIRGEEIEIIGTQAVTFTVGDLVLKLEPAKATLSGDWKLDGKKEIEVVGAPDDLTAA